MEAKQKVKIAFENDDFKLITGSSKDYLAMIEDNTIDAIVTDPPYEIGFFAQDWDNSGITFDVEFWKECWRVLKPGAYLLSFSAARTYHRIAVSIEDAGFTIRDQIMWIYSSGMPKGVNIGKRIIDTKEAGIDAKEWMGWNTSLKPAHEPIIMAQKPLEPGLKTIVYPYGKRAMTSNIENLKKWGVGAINLNDNYVKSNGKVHTVPGRDFGTKHSPYRFPSNIITDGSEEVINNFADVRLFNISKAQANDRHQGLGKQEFGEDVAKRDGSEFCFHQDLKKTKRNIHPTVKPTDLMRHLVRLVAPPGSTIIDPFSGSGSTGKAIAVENMIHNKKYKYIGIDLDDKFNEIAKLRITKGAPIFVNEIMQEQTIRDPDENQLSLMEMFKGDANENI